MITSTGSSQVKRVIQLQKKSKIRKENRQFVVEGVKMVCEAPLTVLKKYICQKDLQLTIRILSRNLE